MDYLISSVHRASASAHPPTRHCKRSSTTVLSVGEDPITMPACQGSHSAKGLPYLLSRLHLKILQKNICPQTTPKIISLLHLIIIPQPSYLVTMKMTLRTLNLKNCVCQTRMSVIQFLFHLVLTKITLSKTNHICIVHLNEKP